jgi:uncharacterized protein
MRFQFDPSKAASNVKKHEVSFADAEAVFEDPLAIHCPDPDAEGEERFLAVGLARQRWRVAGGLLHRAKR